MDARCASLCGPLLSPHDVLKAKIYLQHMKSQASMLRIRHPSAVEFAGSALRSHQTDPSRTGSLENAFAKYRRRNGVPRESGRE